MLLIFWLLVVLVTSFFCSLSEASLLSVNRVRVEALIHKSKAARVLSRLKASVDRPIAAILILNTAANTGGAALAGREYQRLFEGANMGLFTAFLTVMVLIFSELLPKTLGVRQSTKVALLMARPISVVNGLLRPFTWLVEQTSKRFGNAKSLSAVSVDDLRAIARLAVSAEVLGREEQMIIDAAARLPNIAVSQIMIHRQDVVYISLEESEEDILRRARQSMHSRVVLVRGALHEVLGFVNIKEVLWRLVTESEDTKHEGLKRILGESVREPIYVSPDTTLSQLLQTFSLEHEHIALVRVSEENLLGMVTLEDVIEELIGEVDDEYDKSPCYTMHSGENTWRLGGGTLWEEAARALSIGLDEVPLDADLDGRFDINDLAADRLRGKLRTGGVFMVGAWRFKVLRMRRGKVLLVEARLLVDSRRPSPVKQASSAPVEAG